MRAYEVRSWTEESKVKRPLNEMKIEESSGLQGTSENR